MTAQSHGRRGTGCRKRQNAVAGVVWWRQNIIHDPTPPSIGFCGGEGLVTQDDWVKRISSTLGAE